MALARWDHIDVVFDQDDDRPSSITFLGLARPPWMSDGLCREPIYAGVNFFPELGQTAEAAKAVCARCIVAGECGAYAVEHRIRHGVWGGATGRQLSADSVVASDGAKERKPLRPWIPPPAPPGQPPPEIPSCARCPLPVKKGLLLCKDCERASFERALREAETGFSDRF